MTAADIIAREFQDAHRRFCYPDALDFERELFATSVLSALADAGYRISQDDPATAVYGQLLWRHMDAMRKDSEPHRAKIFELIEAFRAEFPAECKVWEDRYTTEDRALAKQEAKE